MRLLCKIWEEGVEVAIAFVCELKAEELAGESGYLEILKQLVKDYQCKGLIDTVCRIVRPGFESSATPLL
jgi:hypothetical protein